jgi:alpha-tubulin suppressor-like RCC1 family protein
MPATNYTPIQLYRSTTSGNLPLAANLSPGELALNIADTDMTMYFENASGVVKRFFNNPAELKYPTADGTSGQFLTTNGAGVLSFGSVAAGALTNNTRQAVTSSATTTINLNSGNVIDLTMAANITTLSFTNVPASGTPILIQIVVKNASDGTAYTIVWPNSVYWSGQYAAATISTVQTAPTLATGANGITVIALLTTDGGTKWRGWVEATIPGGTQGQLYSWGNGVAGKLGQNSAASISSPTQVGALLNWASVSGQAKAVAIKTDGTMWSWGYNAQGQLGQNNIISRSSPVQIGSLTTWASATTNNSSCAALTVSGQLFTWGNNTNGSLGHNSLLTLSSPVQVGTLTDWAEISGGGQAFLARKTNGTMWSWGLNYQGVLGQNDNPFGSFARSSPTQIGALTTWSKINMGVYRAAAIKTDGTAWVWGHNLWGELGINSTTSMSSPVQLGALTTWKSINVASGNYSNCHMLGILTTGELYAWGRNQYGNLGLNHTYPRSSPVQVGALTTWDKASAGFGTSSVIKTDGTLWSWGRNSDGQLGQGNTTPRSSPVQVGALTNWGFISAGSGNATFGITQTSISPA